MTTSTIADPNILLLLRQMLTGFRGRHVQCLPEEQGGGRPHRRPPHWSQRLIVFSMAPPIWGLTVMGTGALGRLVQSGVIVAALPGASAAVFVTDLGD